MVDLGSAVKGGVWGPTKITRLKRTGRKKINKGTNFGNIHKTAWSLMRNKRECDEIQGNGAMARLCLDRNRKKKSHLNRNFGSIHKAAWSLMRDKRECDEIQGNGAMAQLRLHRNRWRSGHWAETFFTQLRWCFKLESVQALFLQWLGSGASSSAIWSCKYAIGYFASFLTPELLAGIGELRAQEFVAQAFQPMGGGRSPDATRSCVALCDVAFSAHIPVCPTDLVASHFCRAFLEAEKVSVWERRLGTQFGLHSECGPHIDGKGILSFTTNVCATMAVHYIGETWFRFADAANAQQAVGMLAEEVWGEVNNDTAVASVAEIEEVEAEVQRTLEIACFLAGPVTQAVWPTTLLDSFFLLHNLCDEWDHLGSAHSLEAMSLTSMMQRSLLPNVLNNRARDMMLQLLARLHLTEELDAVLEFIDRSAIVNRVAVHFSMGHLRDCQTEMLDVTEEVMLCLLWTSTATAIQATAANVCSF
ncbi:hypothetical protein B0H13DRAFT_1853510 [Mycena leptocephala]|nr:hypothetical protein B0H13DRAFT_1853510 [Mycena leptocephala]